MNTVSFRLANWAVPDAPQRRVDLGLPRETGKVFDVLNVLPRFRKEEGKLFIGRLKDAERAIQRAVDDLDVFHSSAESGNRTAGRQDHISPIRLIGCPSAVPVSVLHREHPCSQEARPFIADRRRWPPSGRLPRQRIPRQHRRRLSKAPAVDAVRKGRPTMLPDVEQWSNIRHQILQKGVSIHQVSRDTGIDRKTVRKMLAHPLPKPHGPRSRSYPKLGPHTASIQRMLRENATLPPTARHSVKTIYERIREEEGFRGSYGSVKDYARPRTADNCCIWEYAYDLLVSLEKRRAIDFLFLLSRADPPVISSHRTEQFFRDIGRVISVALKPDGRAQARQAAFEWMRAILQKDIDLDVLHREVGDIPDIASLLQRLYDGRLSDRNRSMVVLASRRGLSGGLVRSFLGIAKKTHRKFLRMFEDAGCAALFSRQIRSTRKFSNEAIKQAVFGLLHEPPSNYGINRTTWIMSDLSRVLRETGYPVCPQVIRTITKVAGYRWRKARIGPHIIRPELHREA